MRVTEWCTIDARSQSIPMKLSQIASALDARLENGSPDTEISGLNGIEHAGPGSAAMSSPSVLKSRSADLKADTTRAAAPDRPSHDFDMKPLPDPEVKWYGGSHTTASTLSASIAAMTSRQSPSRI